MPSGLLYSKDHLKLMSAVFSTDEFTLTESSNGDISEIKRQSKRLFYSEDPIDKLVGLTCLTRLKQVDEKIFYCALNSEEPRLFKRTLDLAIMHNYDHLLENHRTVEFVTNIVLSSNDTKVIWGFNFLSEVPQYLDIRSCNIGTAILNTHENYLCRESAAAFLGVMANYGHTDSLNHLVSHCLDDKVQVKRRALIALGNFDPELVVEFEGNKQSLRDFFTFMKKSSDLQLAQIAEDLY